MLCCSFFLMRSDGGRRPPTPAAAASLADSGPGATAAVIFSTAPPSLCGESSRSSVSGSSSSLTFVAVGGFFALVDVRFRFQEFAASVGSRQCHDAHCYPQSLQSRKPQAPHQRVVFARQGPSLTYFLWLAPSRVHHSRRPPPLFQ